MRLQAVVEALYIGDGAMLEKIAVPSLEFTLEGVAGDTHAGFSKPADARNPEYPRGTPMRNDRQWSAVDPTELAEAAAAMGVDRIEAGWVGANLAIRGIPHFTRLPKGTRLSLPSGAVLVVEAENMPCRGPGRVIASKYPEQAVSANRFPKAALHKRGLVGVVERAGMAHLGDTVTVEVYDAAAYPPPAG